MLRARAKLKGPEPVDLHAGRLGARPVHATIRGRSRATSSTRSRPNNPVFLQFTREAYYLNSKAIEMTGMEKMTDAAIQRDASGRATGIVDGDQVGGRLRNADRRPQEPSDGDLRVEQHADAQGLRDRGPHRRRAAAASSRTSIGSGSRKGSRWRCGSSASARPPVRDATTDQVIAEIPKLRYFDGDEWIDHINWGERFVNVPDNVYDTKPTVPAETWNEWGRDGQGGGAGGHPRHDPHHAGVDHRGAAQAGRGVRRRKCPSAASAGPSCTWSR